MSESILLDRTAGVATLTFDRPHALNTLDLDMMHALVAHVHAIAEDDGVRCVVIRGAGRHFMAGGDIRTFGQALDRPADARGPWFTRMVQDLHAAIDTMQRLPVPFIASVQGAVAGFGLSLVAACDLAIASDDAYFASAYRNIGLSPDGGGTYSLPRIVGFKKAMEILLLGERFDAAEAAHIGLVNRVVPRDALETETARWAQAIVEGPAFALGTVKRLLAQSRTSTLSEQLRAEAEAFGRCAATTDFAEGIAAFLEKRPPNFDP